MSHQTTKIMDVYLTSEFWYNVSYDFYCMLWDFFISWEFGLAVAFLLFLKWYRYQPEVVEV